MHLAYYAWRRTNKWLRRRVADLLEFHHAGHNLPMPNQTHGPARPTHSRDAHVASSNVIVITGGSSGIGRCTAGLFARLGWRVGLIARGSEGLCATRQDIERHGGTACFAPCDVSDPASLEAAATAIENALGPITVWVNCAGNGTFGRFIDTPPEQFQRVTDVTYMGTVNGTRVALQRMMPRNHGRIVNVCSAVAFHGMPLLSSYSGAKHAIRGFGQAVQSELKQDGSNVSVATVFPPSVNTPFFDHAISHMGRSGRPMDPVYQPEVIAEAIRIAVYGSQRELCISSTTVMFSIASRLFPGVIFRAIRLLGYHGQLVKHADMHDRADRTTLFAPSDRVSTARGSFNAGARSRSIQVQVLGLLGRIFAARRNHASIKASPEIRVDDVAP